MKKDQSVQVFIDAKVKATDLIREAIRKAMIDYTDTTGCYLTDVSVEMLSDSWDNFTNDVILGSVSVSTSAGSTL